MCPSSFSQKANLDAHLAEAHINVQFKCRLCAVAFESELELKDHEMAHQLSEEVAQEQPMAPARNS